MSERATLSPPEPATDLLLTSLVLDVAGQGRAVVLMAAQADPARPGHCRLQATVVAEQPLRPGLRLIVRWAGGRRSAALDEAGCARLSGIPAAAVQAAQAGEPAALSVRIERVSRESDALE